ncbi:DUF4452 family conserved fungal protein [Schizosaccharomyces pombe]|uniref:Uncharacterized protein C22H10.02 n=1 Tax=Schizosaccharomyces pombe (strain 972 / ATCC 24843) TaxID=284812 RepID=YD42_SCHPO|nr:uncharacterized protein SPAC22H10.02 [Schizosaccharomyces pombe]Q10296.2 RecName: Full=Uncharacterized protein C22H10.02 [Schizosaccharomyces pombe 972h-]CAA93603.2 conserved fungal protein [Schizosaccharomyces pombe]|eukprot:NP_593738.2 uncharacterized protein SPAC22H10.02 [Schizosaccharomyces pombe]
MAFYYKNNLGYQNIPYGYQLNDFRASFEKARTFDMEDDLEFCPSLSDEELVSIYQSTGLSPTSSSPSLSPMTPNLYPNVLPNVHPGVSNYTHHPLSGLHQNVGSRTRKSSGIPIIDPVTRAPAVLAGAVSSSRAKQMW